jgi:ribosomal protein S18 acetylase RimI-like enzyme
VPWPYRDDALQLLTARAVTAAELQGIVETVEHHGVTTVVSGPLTTAQFDVFKANGFTCDRRLVVLRHDLDVLQPRGFPAPRLATSRTFAQLAELDRAAFGESWGLDAPAIERAVQATPIGQVRVVVHPEPVAYAVVGRAGPTGYLQRLAVHPAHQHQGHGSTLVNWTLRWCRRHRCSSALVNTEDTNAAALGLYRRLGFEPLADPLWVARWSR